MGGCSLTTLSDNRLVKAAAGSPRGATRPQLRHPPAATLPREAPTAQLLRTE